MIMQSTNLNADYNAHESIDSLDIKTEPASDISTYSQGTTFQLNEGNFSTPDVSNYELHTQIPRGRCKQAFWTGVFLLFLASLTVAIVLPLTLGWGSRKPGDLEDNQVETICGIVEGNEKEGVYEFLGIPYALPPIGHRRFKRPVEFIHSPLCKELELPLEGGILKTQDYKPSCLQYKLDYDDKSTLIGSEDCLYLNVYTPETRPRRLRPVIVWITGFLFLYGSANTPLFRVTPDVVKSVDAVHVSFNYRLGPLGFMVNPETRETNFGLRDQLAVLKWIKNNIVEFGGDRDNVILFGFGSGATSALIHYTYLEGFNLFHKVWISAPALQGGMNLNTTLLKQSYNFSKPFSKNETMKHWTWQHVEETFLSQMFDLSYTNKDLFLSGKPVIDNEIIKKDFWNLLEKGRNVKIPIVIGSTSHEALLFPIPKTVRLWSKEELKYIVNKKLDEHNISWQELNSTYLFENDSPIELLYTKLVTDLKVTCPLNTLVDVLSKPSESRLVYRYLLEDSHSDVDPYNVMSYNGGAMHSWDGILFSGGYKNLKRAAENVSMDWSVETTGLLRGLMKEFAWKGSLSKLHRWESSKRITNVLYTGGQLKLHSNNVTEKDQVCKMWNKLNSASFPKYSWSF